MIRQKTLNLHVSFYSVTIYFKNELRLKACVTFRVKVSHRIRSIQVSQLRMQYSMTPVHFKDACIALYTNWSWELEFAGHGRFTSTLGALGFKVIN